MSVSPPLQCVFHAQYYFTDPFHIHVSAVLSMVNPTSSRARDQAIILRRLPAVRISNLDLENETLHALMASV